MLSNHVVSSSHLAFLHWMMQKCTFVAGTCCSECLYRLVRKSECTALRRLRDADSHGVGLEGQNLQVCFGGFFYGGGNHDSVRNVCTPSRNVTEQETNVLAAVPPKALKLQTRGQ